MGSRPTTSDATASRGAAAAATSDGERREFVTVAEPTTVDRYIIVRPLGEGGMGVVYEARDPELDRPVALKLLHPLRGGVRASRRLLREARLLARLSHPNVVQIHDAGEVGSHVFLVMELVAGRTLRQWLATNPGVAEILRRFLEAGRGLAAAHAAGITHRDFKPDNVLIGDDGRVRVADFGLANLEPAAREHPPRASPSPSSAWAQLTATGAVMGTPLFMAPEQHLGGEVGPAADQFAFCVALHRALFGANPFGGGRTEDVADAVLAGRYREPNHVPASLRWQHRVIRRGLAVDPSARHPDMLALLDALARDPARRRRRWLAAGGAAALVATATWASVRAATPTCSDGGDAIAAVWTASTRDTVRDGAAPGQARERLAAHLDRYAERWQAAHAQACAAHRDGAMSAAMFDRATACIERRRHAMSTTVSLLERTGDDPVADALTATLRLPDPSTCLDPTATELTVAADTDPETTLRIEALRLRLDGAKIRHDGGAIEDAQAELGAIEEAAQQLGDHGFVAEVALAIAVLAMDRSDWPVAARHLEVAASQGLLAHLDALVAEAMARKLFVDGVEGPDAARVLADASIAAAMVTRAGDKPELAALLANNTGVLHALLGDRELARRDFTAAAALTDVDRANPIDVAGNLTNLAVLTDDDDEREAIFDRAATLVRQALGDHHLMLLDIDELRARQTSAPELSRRRFAELCPQIDVRTPDAAWPREVCHSRLAELYEQAGDVPAAIAELQLARDALARPLDDHDAAFQAITRDELAGWLAWLRGDAAEALAHLDAAAAALIDIGSRDHAEIADVAWLTARALATLGRRDEARARLAAAIGGWSLHLQRTRDPAVRDRIARARVLLRHLDGALASAGAPSDSR